MDNKQLNVVYIGEPTFPIGHAMTKRWRYMVDYMNANGIQSHVMVCHFKLVDKFDNPQSGKYGMADYIDIRHLFAERKIISFYKVGKQHLKEWFDPNKKNVLIFPTMMACWLFPFYRYAKKLGYKIVFDRVETTTSTSGKMRFLGRVRMFFSKMTTNYASKSAASFVISSALWKLHHQAHLDLPICILPNSTVDLKVETKTSLHTPLKVLYSGTFGMKDGVGYMIDGAIEAHNRGCRLELILMGKGLPWDMKVLDKLKDCPWAKYLGFVSDEELVQQLRQADVLCMTRNNTVYANCGFPFKLSEYMSTGNVVLASRVGDVEQYVKDKESAFLVSPESGHEIADALCYIEKHPEEAIKVAANGYEAMKKHFSIENVGKVFVNFLNQI